MATATNSIFDTLCDRLHVEPDSRGECWVTCPACGKDRKHFSFNEHAGHCFACDYSGSLAQVAELLQIQPDERTRPAGHAQKPQAPRQWQNRPDIWLDRYCGALDRVTRWQGYKPLSLDSISRCRLGVGKLPLWSERTHSWYDYPHRRLIVPVFGADGRCVAFHGRACLPDDDGPKWLSASGSDKRALFVVGALVAGCTVVICENYADAILAYQVEPSACYIPVGGLSWQAAWTDQIAAARPAQVLVWLDHDLSGNGSRYHAAELLALWREKVEARRAANPALAVRPFPKPPIPRGPKIANDFLAVGVKARRFEWWRGAPLKADLGWALMQEGVSA